MLPYLVALLVLVMSAGFPHAIWIPLHLAAFFAGAVACHGALARARPAVSSSQHVLCDDRRWRLARRHFYGDLVAPVVFNRVVEYPLAVILACLAAPVSETWGLREKPYEPRWGICSFRERCFC